MIFRLAFFLGINPNFFNNQIRCNMAINIHKILSYTLLELCKEKKLQSITVQDILKRSGVSRQAFCNSFLERDSVKWSTVCDGLMFESKTVRTLGLYSIPSNILLKNGKIS